MKKIAKIILVILLIIAIILVIAWFRARQAAQQQGTPPPSFREFLGLGTTMPSKQPVTGTGTGLTSDFTKTDTATDTTGGSSSGTATSQFTSGAFSPTQSTSLGTTKLSSGKAGAPLSGGSTLGGSGTTSPAGSGTPAPGPGSGNAGQGLAQCSDADITIQFTPDEINRLNALQNRFYAIAGKLHTDADIATEVANHDTFKAKVDQITELYNYCVAQSPKITAPLYTTRITTPFFRDASRDGSGYWWNMPNGVTFIDLTNGDNFPQDPTNSMMSQASIEQIFKLNLW